MNNLESPEIEVKVNHRLIEQYLNTFLRESGQFVPWADNHLFYQRFKQSQIHEHYDVIDELLAQPLKHPSSSTLISELKQAQYNRKPQIFAYLLRESNQWIVGRIRHCSLMGHHAYDNEMLLINEPLKNREHPISIEPITQSLVLAGLLIKELSYLYKNDSTEINDFMPLIENSEANVLKFIKTRYSKPNLANTQDFRRAEQGLIFGHPFHIISKASTGFSETEKHDFSPELGSEFKLHYFAVRPEYLIQLSSSDQPLTLDSNVLSESRTLLGNQFSEFVLHPCHPWQANYLQSISEFKCMIEKDAVRPLGALGSSVWPTSSVRTVYQPATDSFVKLAINIKITNFVRNNPLNELKRAIDVSRLISQYGLANNTCALNVCIKETPFVILTETHCQTLDTPNIDLQSAFSILYRDGGIQPKHPMVLAYLLEENIATGTPPLFDALIEYSNHIKSDLTPTLVLSWWQRYISISLIPLLKLYSDFGISLEAHLQNCMLTLENGWPKTFYVRDLEGASVNVKDRCILSKDSAACYTEEEAWFRFKYYVVVNHIGHFIATLSRTTLIDETSLWSSTLNMLATSILCDKAKDGSRYMRLVHDLCHSKTLPAKMNMISRFNGHSEKPDFIEIPNPMTEVTLEAMNDSAA